METGSIGTFIARVLAGAATIAVLNAGLTSPARAAEPAETVLDKRPRCGVVRRVAGRRHLSGRQGVREQAGIASESTSRSVASLVPRVERPDRNRLSALAGESVPPAGQDPQDGHRLRIAVSHSVSAEGRPDRSPAPDWKDDAIRRAFNDVLYRKPSGVELRFYRERIDQDGWTERDVRNDLRSRYRPEPRDVDRVIRRAYQDILEREPDPAGARTYRREMIDNGWTEQQVRQALRDSSEYAVVAERTVRRVYKELLGREPDAVGLRNYRREILENDWTEQDVRKAVRQSPEYAAVKEQTADRTVRRLYQEVLGRDPDDQGLVLYRNHMVYDDWTERAVRDALMKSPEYIEKNRMTREKAEEIVRRAYKSVLGREPDPGAEGYVQKVLREKWTEADVARELRKSAEYKNKRR